VVVFVHGSGSSRHSARNQAVAPGDSGFRRGTLLFDPLTPEEEAEDNVTGELRFNIELLASRLTAPASRLKKSCRGAKSKYLLSHFPLNPNAG